MAKTAVMIQGENTGSGCCHYLVTAKTWEIIGEGAEKLGFLQRLDTGRVHRTFRYFKYIKINSVE